MPILKNSMPPVSWAVDIQPLLEDIDKRFLVKEFLCPRCQHPVKLPIIPSDDSVNKLMRLINCIEHSLEKHLEIMDAVMKNLLDDLLDEFYKSSHER